MECIKQLSESELYLATQKPEEPYTGYEITLSKDVSEVAKLFYNSELTYVKGFRLPGISSPTFEVADIMKHFDYFFYVVHMAQLLSIKQHSFVYIVLTNSYSVNFFKSNVRAFNEFICNMIMLNNSCTYVEFIVENAPLSCVYEDELILVQNAGYPSSGLVNLLNGAGLRNFYEGFNVHNAVEVLSSGYVQNLTYDDYLSDSCKLVIMGKDNVHLSERMSRIIRHLGIPVSGVDSNFGISVDMEV